MEMKSNTRFIITGLMYMQITVAAVFTPAKNEQQHAPLLLADTVYSGVYYEYRPFVTDKKGSAAIEVEGLPVGLTVSDSGSISGVTFDEGYYRCVVVAGTNTEKNRYQVLFIVKNIQEKGLKYDCIENVEVFPNPFIEKVNVRYRLDREYDVEVNVFNKKGELVGELVDEKQKKGQQTVTWSGIGQAGKVHKDGWYYLLVKLVDDKGQTYTEIRRILKKSDKYVLLPFVI
jgi:hypothetical protein